MGLFEATCLCATSRLVYTCLLSLKLSCVPHCLMSTRITLFTWESLWRRNRKTKIASKSNIISLLIFLTHQTLRCLKAGPVPPTSGFSRLAQPRNSSISMKHWVSESDIAPRVRRPEVFSLRSSLLWIKALPLQASSLKMQIPEETWGISLSASNSHFLAAIRARGTIKIGF